MNGQGESDNVLRQSIGTRTESSGQIDSSGREQQQRRASGGSGGPGGPASKAASTGAGNGRKRRQRVEYMPVHRASLEHPGTWDISQVEEIVSHATSKRQKRTYRDLGVCDIRTLTMSLRSRIGTEVAFALNSLGLLSAAPPNEMIFNLANFGSLHNELLELFEDAILGTEDVNEDSGDESAMAAQDMRQSPSKAGPGPATIASAKAKSYSSTHSAALDDEYRFRHTKASEESSQTCAGLPRAILVQDLLALLRNLSVYDEANIRLICQQSPDSTQLSFLQLILLATQTVEQKKRLPGAPPSSIPLELSETQLLQIRKEAIQIMGNLGHYIQLDKSPTWVGQAITNLLDYFLQEPQESISITEPLQAPRQFGPGLDAALLVLAKLALPDPNREALSKLPSSPNQISMRTFIISKFDILFSLLPVTDSDFQHLTAEPLLLRMEIVTMCIFNLIYIAPPELRKKLRERPGVVKVLARIVKRLYGAHIGAGNGPPNSNNNQYLVLCQRCIEILRIISEDEATGNSAGASTTGAQEGVAWFGGSFSDLRDGGEGGTSYKTRPSLLFCKQTFIELLSIPMNDKAIFSSLADCT